MMQYKGEGRGYSTEICSPMHWLLEVAFHYQVL